MGADGMMECPVCGAPAFNYYESSLEHGWSCWACGSSSTSGSWHRDLAGYGDEPLDTNFSHLNPRIRYGCTEYISDFDGSVEEINSGEHRPEIWYKTHYGEARYSDSYKKDRILFDANVYQGKMIILHWEKGYKPHSLFGMTIVQDESTGKWYAVESGYNGCVHSGASHRTTGFKTKKKDREDDPITFEIRRQVLIYEKLMLDLDWSKTGQVVAYNKHDVIFTSMAVVTLLQEEASNHLEHVTADNCKDLLCYLMWGHPPKFSEYMTQNLINASTSSVSFGTRYLAEFFKDIEETRKLVYAWHEEYVKYREQHTFESDHEKYFEDLERSKRELKEHGPNIPAIQNGAAYLEIIKYYDD